MMMLFCYPFSFANLFANCHRHQQTPTHLLSVSRQKNFQLKPNSISLCHLKLKNFLYKYLLFSLLSISFRRRRITHADILLHVIYEDANTEITRMCTNEFKRRSETRSMLMTREEGRKITADFN